MGSASKVKIAKEADKISQKSRPAEVVCSSQSVQKVIPIVQNHTENLPTIKEKTPKQAVVEEEPKKNRQRENEKGDGAGEIIKDYPLRSLRSEAGQVGGASARFHGAVHLVLLPARPQDQAPQAFRGVLHPERDFPAAVQAIEADPAHAGQG